MVGFQAANSVGDWMKFGVFFVLFCFILIWEEKYGKSEKET